MPSDRQFSEDRHGFFLQIRDDADDVHSGIAPVLFPNDWRQLWRVYVEVIDRIDASLLEVVGYEIRYHMFFARDGGAFGLGEHEGDWERVYILTTLTGEFLSAHYFAHGSANSYGIEDVAFANANGVEAPRGREPDDQFHHPVVYITEGKHASLPRVASGFNAPDFDIRWGSHTGMYFYGSWLSPDPDDSWILYGGRWGEVGTASATSGPVGPVTKGDYCKTRGAREFANVCVPSLDCSAEPGGPRPWAVLFESSDFSGSRELHFADSRSDDQYFSDYDTINFNDKVQSLRLCTPEGWAYELYSDYDYTGDTLRIVGTGRIQAIRLADFPDFLSEPFGLPRVSSSRFRELD